MPKLSNLSFALCLTCLILFTACSKKSNKLGRYIPENASMVMHFDGEALNEKLPWSEVKQNQLFQELYNDTAMSAVFKSALENPENTGIDIKDDFIMYVMSDSTGGYAVLQGDISDAEKFKAYNASVNMGAVTTGKDDVNTTGNEKMISVWNKERFMIFINTPQMPSGNMFPPSGNFDSLIIDTPTPLPVYTRDLRALSATAFNIAEDNSLAKNEIFGDLADTKGDVHFWINFERISESVPSMGPITPMSMVDMSKLYKGSLLTGTATFLEGKISVDMKSYAGKEMTDLFKKYEGSKINSDMVKRLPSGDIAMLMAFNFKPEGLKEFLKLLGMDGFANMAATQFGFTVDDFVKGNKGELLVAISNIVSDTSGKPGADFLFTAGINDKAAFNKIVEAGKKMTQKPGDTSKSMIYSNLSDNYFAIGSSQSTVDTYIKGGGNNNFNFDLISGSPFGFYLNFQSIFKSFTPAANADSLKLAAFNASKQMWDNIIAKGGEFKDGGIVQHMEINLIDKKTNSLKQLNTYMGTLGELAKKGKAMNKNWPGNNAEVRIDTTITVSPN